MIVKNCKDVPLEATQAPGAGIRWMLTKEDGAPGFALRVCVVDAGAESPYHEHEWEHELFVLDGEGEIRSGDELTSIVEGDAVLIHPNEPHQVINPGEETLRFVCLIPNLD